MYSPQTKFIVEILIAYARIFLSCTCIHIYSTINSFIVIKKKSPRYNRKLATSHMFFSSLAYEPLYKIRSKSSIIQVAEISMMCYKVLNCAKFLIEQNSNNPVS